MAVKHRPRRRTFRQILAEALPENAARLWMRARRLNRIAKAVNREKSRELAYLGKDRCILQLRNHCPDVYRERPDLIHPDRGIVLVGVFGQPGWLHTHPRWLEGAA